MSTQTERERASLDAFREALLGREVRIEVAPTLNLTQGTMVETARIYTRTAGGRWHKVDPLLLPKDGGGRADLLDDLAKIVRGRPATLVADPS